MPSLARWATARSFLFSLLCLASLLLTSTASRAQLAFQSLQDFPWSLPPSSALVAAPDGYFYGLTRQGGPRNGGTIYRIAPGQKRHIAHHFVSVQSYGDVNDGGALPESAFVLASDGCFYGTTRLGGAYGFGVIFKFDPAGAGFSAVHHFKVEDGVGCAGLFAEASGDLIGFTHGGGPLGGGVIFRFSLQGTYSLIHAFEADPSVIPMPAQKPPNDPFIVIQGSDGLLYGMTQYGGPTRQDAFFPAATFGTFFRVDPAGGITILHEFTRAEGRSTRCLVEGPDGHLYGLTQEAMFQHKGTFFRLTKPGVYTALHPLPLDESEGGMSSGLILASDGAFYSNTFYGGPLGGGVIQRYTASGEFSIVHEFALEYRAAGRSGMIESGGFLYGILNGSQERGFSPVRTPLRTMSAAPAEPSLAMTSVSAAAASPRKAAAYRLKIDPAASDNAAPATRSEVRIVPKRLAKLIVRVLANDRDPDRDPLTIAGVVGTSEVQAAIESSGRHLRLTMPAPLTSSQVVTYTVTDGNGGLSKANVLLRPKINGRYRCNLTGETATGTATLTVGATGVVVGTIKVGAVVYRLKGRIDRDDRFIGVARARSGEVLELNLKLTIGAPNLLTGSAVGDEEEFTVSSQ